MVWDFDAVELLSIFKQLVGRRIGWFIFGFYMSDEGERCYFTTPLSLTELSPLWLASLYSERL